MSETPSPEAQAAQIVRDAILKELQTISKKISDLQVTQTVNVSTPAPVAKAEDSEVTYETMAIEVNKISVALDQILESDLDTLGRAKKLRELVITIDAHCNNFLLKHEEQRIQRLERKGSKPNERHTP